MTERERTDFLHGDTNNEHFHKRGRGTPNKDLGTKKRRADDPQDASRKTGEEAWGQWARVTCHKLVTCM